MEKHTALMTEAFSFRLAALKLNGIFAVEDFDRVQHATFFSITVAFTDSVFKLIFVESSSSSSKGGVGGDRRRRHVTRTDSRM